MKDLFSIGISHQDLGRIYHPTYHEDTGKNGRSIGAARVVLPVLFECLEIDSVLDVGCGAGTWLAVARDLGATRLKGLEGPWGESWPREDILPETDFEFRTQDLEDRLDVGERFDLAISLEVAEHLSVNRGPSFIADLCTTSDWILFGAAIPGQGGTRHLNERWPSYWAGLFRKHGFEPLDVIRPRVWGNPSVAAHYQQNIILFRRSPIPQDVLSCLRAPLPSMADRLDMVHPLYHMSPHSFLTVLGALPRALRKTLERRIRRWIT